VRLFDLSIDLIQEPTKPFRKEFRNLAGIKGGGKTRKANNIIAICEQIKYKALGASMSHKAMDLNDPSQG
jgi:hypothetical protein